MNMLHFRRRLLSNLVVKMQACSSGVVFGSHLQVGNRCIASLLLGVIRCFRQINRDSMLGTISRRRITEKKVFIYSN